MTRNKPKNTGNYVQPKLLEFNTNGFLRSDEENQQSNSKGRSNQNGRTKDLAFKGNLSVPNTQGNFTSNANLNHFQDSQISIQKYYNVYLSKSNLGAAKN